MKNRDGESLTVANSWRNFIDDYSVVESSETEVIDSKNFKNEIKFSISYGIHSDME